MITKNLFLGLAISMVSITNALADTALVASANNDFSFKLYHGLSAGKNENTFISPYSVYTALSLSYAGSNSNTKKEFEKTMGISDPESFHDAMSKNMESLNERDGKGFSISVANALWIDKKTEVLGSYRDLLKNYYHSLESVFDKNEPETAAKKVNNWVSEKTKEKIKDLVSPGNMQASDLVLTNAIYFKGDWWMPFKKEATQEKDFSLFTGNKVKVQMMSQSSHFNYQVIDGDKFIELPYKNSELSMILVLPEKEGREGLANAENKLSNSFKKFDSAKSKDPKVILSLPKFKVETPLLTLNEPLKKLGIKDAFSYPAADFSGINGNRDLFIGLVVHKAMINVDELGTEAAAATAVMMRAGAAYNPDKPEEFNADRPFIYLIRDKKTGLVLFVGKIINPV